MTNRKFAGVLKSVVLLSAAFIFWFYQSIPANAQKMLTGSAWRSVSQGTGTIPSHTKIRIRTTEAINPVNNNCREFHGVVARDVIGSSGRVLINKGSDAEFIVKESSQSQMVLDLDNIIINGQVFSVEPAGIEVETVPIATSVRAEAGEQVLTRGETINVPQGSILTFRLLEPLVVEG